MNALVKKEIRLLLPSFAIAAGLTVSNLFLPCDPSGGWLNTFRQLLPFIGCPLMGIALALASFGGEVSAGTFGMLLTQPVSRQKIWDTKISLLAFAVFIIGALAVVFSDIWSLWRHQSLDLFNQFTAISIVGMVVFSGGLWTVLLLRQVAAAFWLMVLLPFALLIVRDVLFPDWDYNYGAGVDALLLGLYSLAGFFLARWLFLRAQDVPWSGGAIVLPELRGLAWFNPGTRRAWRPKMALFRKELQLHQAQFVFAGVLLVCHAGVLITRHLGHFRFNSTTWFVLQNVWLFWLALPLLVGTAAVAEERKLGTHAGQLCLPAGHRTQFAVKTLVVLGLSAGFGMVLPLLMEGSRILPADRFHMGQSLGWASHAPGVEIFLWHLLKMIDGLLPLLTLAGATVLIGGVAFYVSSLTRNLLESLAPAVVGVGLAWVLILLAPMPVPGVWQGRLTGENSLWYGPLPYFIVLPIMVATILWLAYRNYQCQQLSWRVGRNALTLVTAFVLGVAVTAAVYHRAWEKLTPFEPAHGPARLTLSNPPVLSSRHGVVAASLPAGRTWVGAFKTNDLDPLACLLGNFKLVLQPGTFLGGSNWLSLTRVAAGMIGVRADGTLWFSENPHPPDRLVQWPYYNQMAPFERVGTATNWSQVASFELSALLVKQDGTLWIWGPRRFDFGREKWPGLRAFTPLQLGAETNWATVEKQGFQINLIKNDGRVWEAGDWQTNGQTLLEIEPGLVFHALPASRAAFSSVAMISHWLQFKVGVRNDGTFRIYADQRLNPEKKLNDYDYVWQSADLPLGTGTNWLAVAGDWNDLVTLRADGTLWRWEVPGDGFHQGLHPEELVSQAEREVRNMVPVRLGTHSDWVAVAGNAFDVVSLAADGSLWYWPLESMQLNNIQGDDSNLPIVPLLETSWKPQFLGNIFAPAQ